MTAFGRPLRRRFALEAGTAFLNHGSFGAAPRSVIAAAGRWRARMEASPDRFMRDLLPGALRDAARQLAAFLKVDSDDLGFVENATSATNAVLRSLDFRPGDEILCHSHTYNAVRQSIREVCRRSGARLVDAAIPLPVRDASELILPIRRKLSARTRLVVLDHIASPTGLVFPVRKLARLARARGARVLVDGAHAPGQIALDIASLGVDWYAGNCHKWLFAPRGCGFLWAHPRAQAGLHPLQISHGYGKGLAAEFDWPGTRDFSAWLAMPEALRFFRRINPGAVRAHNHRLVTGAARRIASAWNTPLDGPPGLHGAMMAIRLPERWQGQNPAQVAEYFARRGVFVAIAPIGGALWARISAQVYNTPQDYGRLLAASGRSTP